MTKFATIDWFGRWGTSGFSENTAIFPVVLLNMPLDHYNDELVILPEISLYLRI